MVDIALSVERLLPDALYRDASSYPRLLETWFDARAIPTEADINTAWDAILAERAAAEAREVQATATIEAARTNARNIPQWAGWDETQAVDWINNNVTDLNSAKTALVALARMVVALRDAQWPSLGD